MLKILSAAKSNPGSTAQFRVFYSSYDTANTPAVVAKIVIEQDTVVAVEQVSCIV